MSEYGKQIKAFFHFMFKHLFEIEFGFRVVVEVLFFMCICYILLMLLFRLIHKIVYKLKDMVDFLYIELIAPLWVRLYEKIAFSTNNPNWQERANEMKEGFKKNKDERTNTFQNSKNVKKKHTAWWIFSYIVLVVWIVGFHYCGEEKRGSYEVFFLGEQIILDFEDWMTNTWLDTDEHVVECYFHGTIEAN